MLACDEHGGAATLLVLQGLSSRHLACLAAPPHQQQQEPPHPSQPAPGSRLARSLAATALALVLSVTGAAGPTAPLPPLLPPPVAAAYAEPFLFGRKEKGGAATTTEAPAPPVEPAILDAPVDRMVEPPAMKKRDDLTPEELRSIRIFQENTPSVCMYGRLCTHTHSLLH